MKAVFAVLFAVVAVAQAGLLAGTYTALTGPAIAAHGLAAPYALGAPYGIAAPYGLGLGLGLGAHGLAAPYAAHVAAPAVVAAHAAPVSYAAHVPYAAPVGAAYNAVTRGAVHSAPLPGHAIGSNHVNVQPAPGTL